jgi:hypothetical protein
MNIYGHYIKQTIPNGGQAAHHLYEIHELRSLIMQATVLLHLS